MSNPFRRSGRSLGRQSIPQVWEVPWDFIEVWSHAYTSPEEAGGIEARQHYVFDNRTSKPLYAIEISEVAIDYSAD